MAKVYTDTSRGSIVCSTQAITRGEGEQTRKFQRNFRRAPNFPKMAALHLGMDNFASRDTRGIRISRAKKDCGGKNWLWLRTAPRNEAAAAQARARESNSPATFPKTKAPSTNSGDRNLASQWPTMSPSGWHKPKGFRCLNTSRTSSTSTGVAQPAGFKGGPRWRFSHEKAPLRFADQKALYRCCGRFTSLAVQESSSSRY